MSPELLSLATAATALIGAIFTVGRLAKVAWTVYRRIGHALDLIIGVPAIGESPERPGIIARMELIEDRTEAIEKEVRPNGGSSIKDKVNEIQRSVDRVEGTLTRHIQSHRK